MSRPDPREVYGALVGVQQAMQAGQLIAYPAHLDGVRVTVVGRNIERPGEDASDSVPYVIVINDELLAKLDITEAQT